MTDQEPYPFSLTEGERLEVAARTTPALFGLTDHGRMIVATGHRVSLDVPVAAIRRIQLDVERGRPSTLVIVPHHPSDEPQVLAVPHEELAEVVRAVHIIGLRLQEYDH